MKIFVCVKHVPDTAANIKVDGQTSFADKDVKFIANPYDEFGVEEAVKLTEANGGEVVVVCLGGPSAKDAIRSALAMGAARGIHIITDAQFTDSQVTAKALAAAIAEDGGADMVFGGKSAVDTETSQTLYRVASILGLPVASEVNALVVDGTKATATLEAAGGKSQVLGMALPCVIGATKGLNQPRYPKFPDIMKSKKKPIKDIALADCVGDTADAAITYVALEPVPDRAGAKILQGSVEEQVTELVRILKEDEKVIA